MNKSIQERRMDLWTDVYLSAWRPKVESIKEEPQATMPPPPDKNAKSSRCVAADHALREFDEAFGIDSRRVRDSD